MEEGGEGVEDAADDDVVELVDSAADLVVQVVEVAEDAGEQGAHFCFCYVEDKAIRGSDGCY